MRILSPTARPMASTHQWLQVHEEMAFSIKYWCDIQDYVHKWWAEASSQSLVPPHIKAHTTVCPKKGLSLHNGPDIRSRLKTKEEWVLENSVNFLFNKHKNSPFTLTSASMKFSSIVFMKNDLKKLSEKQNMYQWGFLGDSVIKNFLNDSS